MTMFTDPHRERDLHGLGIDATVTSDGHMATVTLPVDKLDRITSAGFGHESCCTDDDVTIAYGEGREDGLKLGRKAALAEVDAFLRDVKAAS